MPTWPTASSTSNLDAGTDSPAAARPDIKAAVDNVNAIIAARGAASGIASLDSSTHVPIAELPLMPFANGLLSYADSDTWTIPAGVTKIYAICTGGGGGGGYSDNDGLEAHGSHGGGGGGGGTAIKLFDVTPGEAVTITVGAAGAGGGTVGDNDGADGGDSAVSIGSPARVITGEGGKGGKGGGSAYGGAGGGATGGDANIIGGVGVSGMRKGGAGGSSYFMGSAAGSTGTDGGYGGGGGYGSGSPGGAGKYAARGLVLILW